MKNIILSLLIALIINQRTYKNQNIYVDMNTKPINLEFFKDSKVIENFQIGFYLNLKNINDEFTLVSLTDFFNFNINIDIKNNLFININNKKTNWKLNYGVLFFYLKIESINDKLNLIVSVNELSNNLLYIYNHNLKNINLKEIQFILGSNKNLLNFKFEGSIMYLGSYINTNINNFQNLKDIITNILVYNRFVSINRNDLFFENSINNGFSGFINGSNHSFKKNGGDIFYSGNSMPNVLYLFGKNSYITLSDDFIKYLSGFELMSYSVYLSMILFKNNNFSLNFEPLNIYIYKRNDLEFRNELIATSKNSYNYKIYTSNNMELFENNNNINIIFRNIFIKIKDIQNNNYIIQYIYEIYNLRSTKLSSFKKERNEYHNFSKNDKHISGLYNKDYKELNVPNFKIDIFDIALILGTNFINESDSLYILNENKKFLLTCYSEIKILNKDKTCNFNFKYLVKLVIENCNSYKDGKCFKCKRKKILKNNNCWEDNPYENFILKYNYKGKLNRNRYNIISFNLGDKYELFKFDFSWILKNEYNMIIVKINGEIVYENSNINGYFYLFTINIFLKNMVKIEIFGKTSLSYNLLVFKNNYYDLNKLSYNSEIFDYLNNVYFNSILNYKEVTKNLVLNVLYYKNNKGLILKCNKCRKCVNGYRCLICNDNFILNNGLCIKNNKFKIIKNCHKGCKSCNSLLFNECLSCIEGYLIYPELKQCFKSNICKNNYNLTIIDNTNTCLSYCKKYKNINKCVSCNNLLNLNLSSNKCIKCSNNSNYYKNLNILDSENRPTCEKCSNNCKSCTLSKYQCTSCFKNRLFLIDKFKCVNKCPSWYFKNKNNCFRCKLNCLNCKNDFKCLKCIKGKFIKNGLCVNNCGSKYYLENYKCNRCSSNCLRCENNKSCLECATGFYKNNKNICVICNLPGEFKYNKKCLKCSNNCKTCIKNKNICLTCPKGLILKNIKNLSFCSKTCGVNKYFDLNKNKCFNCNKCKFCYTNYKLNCFECPKCKEKCKLKIFYDNFGIHIESDKNYGIKFNKNYKLKNLITQNILENNKIKLWFNSTTNNFKVNLINEIIEKSNNCYGLSQYKYYLNKIKTDCFIFKIKVYNNDNKITIQIVSNIIYKDNFNINFFIKDNIRLIDYKIKIINYINNQSYLLIDLFPNYYKLNYNITMIINKSSMNIYSPCNLNNIIKKFSVIQNENKIFMPDYKIYKNIIKPLFKNKVLNTVKKITDQYQNILKNSSLILIFINLFHTGNLLPLWNIIQLVYFLELILLLPVDLGDNVNTFIKYLKLDLDHELDINPVIRIKDKTEIEKFYKDFYYVNSKISDLNWINILNFQIDILFIIWLYLFQLFLFILKKIIIKIKKNEEYGIKYIDKLILNTKIVRFKFIESFKIIMISILVVYLSNINKFKLNFDNIKIYFIVIFYYIMLSNYFYELINSIIYSKYQNNKINIYYDKILIFEKNKYFLNVIYQLIISLRELLFVLIIFLLKNSKLHVILFLIIQVLFIIFLYNLNLDNKIFFLLNKIKIEEIINLILIINIIWNYYLKLDQFQISFIIFYTILLVFNFLILFTDILKYIFFVINFKFKKLIDFTYNKTRSKVN